jgi:serine/threonine-protein kinase
VAGYRIDGVAGRGGMGIVYRARQLALDRPVALKVIAPDLADDVMFRERFKRESLTAASIDHPNVIPVYEAGEAEGQLFIAMRWVEGTDLRLLIQDGGPMEPGQAIRVIEQVAAALDAAHRGGLVHRDVKPANVLLDAEGRAFLSDFGLAKLREGARLTRTGMWVGTVEYIAPEQIMAGAVGPPADVYALGAVTYEALTGRTPYVRAHPADVLQAHLRDEPRPASTFRRSLGGADAVLARALAKGPERRYASAGAFAHALSGALGA